MARIESWFKQDLSKPVKVHGISGNLFSADNQGNLIGVEVFNNGEPVTLSGTVSANVIRPDGATVPVSGSKTENKASVILPAAAYAYPGIETIVLKLTEGSVVTTLAAVVVTIYQSSTNVAVDPGTIIPSIEALISEIQTAVASIPADYSSLWTTLAPAYSTSSTYAVGQYVTYDGKTYRCVIPIATPEAWTAAHWAEVNTGNEIYDFRSALTLDESILLTTPYFNTFNVIAGGVNTSDAKNNSTSSRARTQFFAIEPGTSYMIDLTDTEYCIINTWLYSSDGPNNGVRAPYTGNSSPITRRVIFTASASNEKYCRVCFAHSDKSTAITDADLTAIKAGLKIYTSSDSYAFRGDLSDLEIESISECTEPGWYNIGASYLSNISDLPPNINTGTPAYIRVYKPGAGLASANPIVQECISLDGNRWIRRIMNGTETDWIKESDFAFNAYFADTNYTNLKSCIKSGWYGLTQADYANITDLPPKFGATGGSMLVVYNPTMSKPASGNTPFVYQFLIQNDGVTWGRTIRESGTVNRDWWLYNNGIPNGGLIGKTVAILGASNDTHGNPGSGTYPNVPEIEITADDVGVELSAYLTYYDVNNSLSLGGHTFTSDEIGTEVTFTPTADDIGKFIGRPANYNSNSLKVWWLVAAETLGFTPIPVCWSGASVTSHEGTTNTLKTSYAWHDAQIRKCGIRTPGSMTRTAPDVIIITRGLNDYGHEPYTVLTDGYFDDPDFEYPTTDQLPNDKYGFMEGLVLTIKKLRAAYPKAQIMLATMKMALRPAGMWSAFPPRNGENTIIQYSDAFRKVADYMGCQVLELDKCGITYENFLSNYCTDTSSTAPSHANAAGHKLMGERAIIDLQKLSFES